MSLTCSFCENNIALTIYQGNALCSACFHETKKLLAERQKRSLDINT